MDRCRSLGFILHGSLQMTKILSTGKELIIKYLIRGDMFAELICFSNKNYPYYISTTEESFIFELPTDALYKLFKEDQFITAFMNDVSQKSTFLTNTIELLAFKKVDKKIAYFLLSNNHNLNVTQLADKINSSRESVSRALSKLEKQGFIKKIKKIITITDRGALEELII